MPRKLLHMMNDIVASSSPRVNLGLLCAGGAFPRAVAQAALKNGYDPFLILLEGLADPKLAEDFSAEFVRIGQLGKMIALLKKHRCTQLVTVGALVRPPILSSWPDFKMLTCLPRLVRAYKGGDNHLLTHVAHVFEQEGIMLKGIHEIAPHLLMPKGALTHLHPSAQQHEDITFALHALAQMGAFDIGQAMVLHQRHIIAVEGAEGTDGLLARIKTMREDKRIPWTFPNGLLVKALKPQQDARLDMPAIGLQTLNGLVEAGLKGLAVQAGATLMLNSQEMIDYANTKGIFIYGA